MENKKIEVGQLFKIKIINSNYNTYPFYSNPSILSQYVFLKKEETEKYCALITKIVTVNERVYCQFLINNKIIYELLGDMLNDITKSANSLSIRFIPVCSK